MSPPGHRAGRDNVVAEVALQLGFARRFAMTCGVRREDLEDFLQDVAVAALKRIDQGDFRPPDPEKPLREAVRAWLTGIVRFMALEQRRRSATRARLLASGPTRENPIDPDAHAVPSPEARIDAREELEAIGRMKLSRAQREVVRLTALGHTAEQVGRIMGFSPNTASTHLTRARKAYEKAKGKRRG